MKDEVRLTPGQLFYIGKVIDAKHMDFAYYAAMENPGEDFRLFETKLRDEVINAGIVSEDFRGNIKIDDEVKSLILPVFESDIESTIDVCYKDDVEAPIMYKFHFANDFILKVTVDGDYFVFTQSNETEVCELLSDLIPDMGLDYSEEKLMDFDSSQVKSIMSFKHIKLGLTSEVRTYFVVEGKLAYENSSNEVYAIGPDTFEDQVKTLILGR